MIAYVAAFLIGVLVGCLATVFCIALDAAAQGSNYEGDL